MDIHHHHGFQHGREFSLENSLWQSLVNMVSGIFTVVSAVARRR
jgi:hypothetical protein